MDLDLDVAYEVQLQLPSPPVFLDGFHLCFYSPRNRETETDSSPTLTTTWQRSIASIETLAFRSLGIIALQLTWRVSKQTTLCIKEFLHLDISREPIARDL